MSITRGEVRVMISEATLRERKRIAEEIDELQDRTVLNGGSTYAEIDIYGVLTELSRIVRGLRL